MKSHKLSYSGNMNVGDKAAVASLAPSCGRATTACEKRGPFKIRDLRCCVTMICFG